MSRRNDGAAEALAGARGADTTGTTTSPNDSGSAAPTQAGRIRRAVTRHLWPALAIMLVVAHVAIAGMLLHAILARGAP